MARLSRIDNIIAAKENSPTVASYSWKAVSIGPRDRVPVNNPGSVFPERRRGFNHVHHHQQVRHESDRIKRGVYHPAQITPKNLMTADKQEIKQI
jgi:hypothetical protein